MPATASTTRTSPACRRSIAGGSAGSAVYSDAQMRFPERYCVALLEDARQIAATTGVDFRLFTYSQAEFIDETVKITDTHGVASPLTPQLVINATGAWGDLTLGELPRAGAATFWRHQGEPLCQPSGGAVQAGDRPVRRLRRGGRRSLDLCAAVRRRRACRHHRRAIRRTPETAVASNAELTYLIKTVNELFPGVHLVAGDVTLTYSGVRPLPYAGNASEASISHNHSIAVQSHGRIPVLTLVGGKLTTSAASASWSPTRSSRVWASLARR